MTNPFYSLSGNPPNQTRGISALMRAEFQLIQNAFDSIGNVGGINSGIDVGTVNSYIINPVVAVTAYSTLMQTLFLALNTNTGASTINISGIGDAPIKRHDRTALLSGDIQGGGIYLAHYDGTEFQLQSISLSGNATGPINGAKSSAIASASTVSLDGMTGNYGHITGTTTINAITLAAGSEREIIFDGSLTLTASSNLVLPGGNNIVTSQGDAAIFVGDGSSKTILISYTHALGLPGLIKVSSATLGAPAVFINFLNVFNSGCDNYLVLIENMAGDASGSIQMQFAVAGSVVTGTSYGYAGNSAKNNGGSASNAAFAGQVGAVSAIQLTGLVPLTTNGNCSGSIDIFNANSASNWKTANSSLSYATSAGASFDVAGGQFDGGIASGFRLGLTSGGNFTTGSTVTVYAYPNQG